MRLNNGTTRFIIVILLAAVLGGAMLSIPRRAEAVLGFCDSCLDIPKPVITNIPGTNFFSLDWIQKWIINPAVRVVIRSMLQATTQQVVGWIQGGGGKNVGFVANLDQALRQEADAAGGEFLNNLTGLNLCGNIGAFLNISLRTPGLRQRLECTVTDIVRNVESFYANFQNGGWPAFIRISLEPQNNPAGAYLIALDAKISAENRARERVSVGVQAGKGFLGFRVPIERNCGTGPQRALREDLRTSGAQGVRAQPIDQFALSPGTLQFASPLLAQLGPGESSQGIEEAIRQEELRRQEAIRRAEQEASGEIGSAQEEAIQDYAAFEQAQGQLEREAIRTDPNKICDIEYETKTPGGLIADTLSKATNNGIDFANTAKDFDEAIATIINALLNKLITATFAGSSSGTSGQGLFDPGLSRITLPVSENAKIFIAQVDETLFFADALLQKIDENLSQSYLAVFSDRTALLNASAEEKAAIESRLTELEREIAIIHQNKILTLGAKNEVIALKNSLVSASSAPEVSSLARRIPQISSQFASFAQEIGILVIPLPSSGIAKTDTARTIQGTANTIAGTLSLMDVVLNEASRIASTTQSASLKTTAEAQKRALNTEARALATAKAQLELRINALNIALSEAEIDRITRDSAQLLLDADLKIQRADEAIKLAAQAIK